jgi:transcriptional regulator with GAF, ATPase, and Fis domain
MFSDRDSAQQFAGVARVLQSAATTQGTLDTICQLAVDLVDGAEHAAVTLVRGNRFTTVAASSEIPQLIDYIQHEAREGPCLDAIREQESYLSDDLASERRWPKFSRRVVSRARVRSMLAHRLFVDNDTLGALNLYAVSPGAFTPKSEALGAMFAAHAAVAYQAAKEHDKTVNLEIALHSSRRIGMAIGVVMTRDVLTEEQAFEALKAASQRQNRKIVNIAEDVILAGTLER